MENKEFLPFIHTVTTFSMAVLLANVQKDDKETPHESKLVRMLLCLLVCVSSAKMEQSRWVLSGLSHILEHSVNTFQEYRVHRGVGLSVWCQVAIITGGSPRVNSWPAPHPASPHICNIFTFVIFVESTLAWKKSEISPEQNEEDLKLGGNHTVRGALMRADERLGRREKLSGVSIGG